MKKLDPSQIRYKAGPPIALYKRVDAESIIKGVPQNVRDAIWPFYSSIRPNDEVWVYNQPNASGYALVRYEPEGPTVVLTYQVWSQQ
jgi:hypothetical protein